MAEKLERTRLLFVGITRAGDYQILALTGRPTAWLDELCDQGDQAHVRPAVDSLNIGGTSFATRGAPIAPAEAPDSSTDH